MFDSRLDASPARSGMGEGYPEGDKRSPANFPAASTEGTSSMAEFRYQYVGLDGRWEQGIVRAISLEEARKSLDREGIAYQGLVARESLEARAIPASAANHDKNLQFWNALRRAKRIRSPLLGSGLMCLGVLLGLLILYAVMQVVLVDSAVAADRLHPILGWIYIYIYINIKIPTFRTNSIFLNWQL
jgi:hypothetical protein